MASPQFDARVQAVKQRAHGRWDEILAALGVEERIRAKRNGPCPQCGGTDRFQYTDRFGEGNYHCRGCGAGGGFKLLQAVRGIDFSTALSDVERALGMLPAEVVGRPAPSSDRMRQLARRIWGEGQPVTAGDEVDRYLRNRGLALSTYPACLRFHPELGYYEKDSSGGKSKLVGKYPAMLACVQDKDGHAVSLHRTYLQDGSKLGTEEPKKLLAGDLRGAAVRLATATDQLAISEGIENGLAVMLGTNQPVWAGLSASNLEKLVVPPSVQRIHIYGDNDADGEFAGQVAAYQLARRLVREPCDAGRREVRVFVPKRAGSDWCDVWSCRQQRAASP